MSLFRTGTSSAPKPTSPVALFRDLKRAPEVKFLWAHQERTLETYHARHLNSTDVALELPTGSGKTLLGLLVAEYRRRTLNQRVVVLCPTRQLCAQVARQASKYGVPCALLVGKQSKYDEADFLKYQRAQAVGVTTYSGLFNTNPRIRDPQTVICDDAHSGEGFIAEMWTLRINRHSHKKLFAALFSLLKPTMSESHAYQIENNSDDSRHVLVDMLSPIVWDSLIPKIRETIEELLPEDDNLRHVWGTIQNNLIACAAYCTPAAFEFRPSIPPTFTHLPFTAATQRLYMSATLGEDGDLERCFGRRKIERIPITDGWITGRRLILFPELSDLKTTAFLVETIRTSGKALVLMPSTATQRSLEEKLSPSVAVLKSADTEDDIQAFRDHPVPVALVLANRYDGIDFPGDQCRCEVIFDLPLGSSLEELFLTQRLRAISIIRDRLRTRVTQAMGRCTRDESDYSVVLIYGKELLHWFCTGENVGAMHPELQGEVDFGLENSTDRDAAGFLDLIKALLQRTSDWDDAEDSIRKRRDQSSRKPDLNAGKLQASASYEVDFHTHLWSGRYDAAFLAADEVLKILSGDGEIRPYRCFWEHQAAVAAYLQWNISKDDIYKQQCITRLRKASGASFGLAWLSRIAATLDGQNPEPADLLPYMEWFAAINALLTDLRLTGGKFTKAIEQNREFIASVEPNKFHQGLEFLGRMLGANSQQWPSTQTGKPDGFWSFGYWQSYVFEAKTNEKPSEPISLATIRQAMTHEGCVRSDKMVPPTVPCSTVVVSPRTTIRKDAQPHAELLTYISQAQVIQLYEKAIAALTELRIAAEHEDSEKLPETAIRLYKKHDVFIPAVIEALTGMKLAKLPIGDP